MAQLQLCWEKQGSSHVGALQCQAAGQGVMAEPADGENKEHRRVAGTQGTALLNLATAEGRLSCCQQGAPSNST